MNNRPIYTKDQVVILDAGTSVESGVTVIKQTPKRLMTEVRGGLNRWWVMTYRLTELNL